MGYKSKQKKYAKKQPKNNNVKTNERPDKAPFSAKLQPQPTATPKRQQNHAQATRKIPKLSKKPPQTPNIKNSAETKKFPKSPNPKNKAFFLRH
jgi:hypothetical protein